MALILCCFSVKAQSFQVEKAHKVKVADKKVTTGMSLSENDIVSIDNNGYLLLVDMKSKNRYYVNFPCRSKVANIIKKGKNPITVTKSFLESFFTSQRRNTDYASAGNVIRGDEDDDLMSVEQKAEIINKNNPTGEIPPAAIEMEPNLVEGETVTLFIVLP